jgi:S1-C subfamily serine protease
VANIEIEQIGARLGGDGPVVRPLVDMADPASTEILKTPNPIVNLDNPPVLQGGYLNFDNIYTQGTIAAATDLSAAAPAAADAVAPAAAATDNGIASGPAVAASATDAIAASQGSAWAQIIGNPVVGEPIGSPPPADLPAGSLAPPPSDSFQAAALAASAAPLTPEQAAVAQSTVQLITPYTDANGQKLEEVGTGFYTQAPDGETVLMTNAHVVLAGNTVDGEVVQNVGQTQVVAPDGTVTTANLAGYNLNTDLAALTVNGPLLPPPTLALNPDATPSPGDTLTSVGYPWGQSQPAAESTVYEGTTPISGDNWGENGRNMMVGLGFTPPGQSGSAVFNADNQVDGVPQVDGLIDKGSDNETLVIPSYQGQALLNDLFPSTTSVLNNPLGINLNPETSGTIATPEGSAISTSALAPPVEAPVIATPATPPPVEAPVITTPATDPSLEAPVATFAATQDASDPSALTALNLADSFDLSGVGGGFGGGDALMQYD